jgi:transposase
MHTNYIKNLLNLEGVIIKKINNNKSSLDIFIELPKKIHICPYCHAETSLIHDYYTQTIKDMPFNSKPVNIIYRKRRYKCASCGKMFFENNSIVSKYSRHTMKLTDFIVNSLHSKITQKQIAKQANVSATFVSKFLPYLAVSCSHLPKVLCIDEFKGNSGHYKYQVILLDGETHKVVDIVECRYKHFLCDYFRRFPQAELDNVKFLVSDLWETYKDIGMTYFKHAKIVADTFHYARYACNVVDSLRKQVQSKLPKEERKFFKHSRRLLLSRHSKITNEEDLDDLNYMLINFSEDLRIAYSEKESLLDIIHSSDASEIKIKSFNNWVTRNLSSPVSELAECAKTYQHWIVEIRHSLEVPFSNGPTEGVNNKIKVLKRLSFGMPNFTNFKARILLLNN